jgi:hypothetical protein
MSSASASWPGTKFFFEVNLDLMFSTDFPPLTVGDPFNDLVDILEDIIFLEKGIFFYMEKIL